MVTIVVGGHFGDEIMIPKFDGEMPYSIKFNPNSVITKLRLQLTMEDFWATYTFWEDNKAEFKAQRKRAEW